MMFLSRSSERVRKVPSSVSEAVLIRTRSPGRAVFIGLKIVMGFKNVRVWVLLGTDGKAYKWQN